MEKLISKDEVDADLVDIMNALFPFEKHLPRMNYWGPGTDLNKKLNFDGTPKAGFEPVDRIDEAALKHDKAYARNPTLRQRLMADKIMINEIKSIQNPSFRERCEMYIVLPIMRIKRFFGVIVLWFRKIFGWEV